jgi:hypothetical protein
LPAERLSTISDPLPAPPPSRFPIRCRWGHGTPGNLAQRTRRRQRSDFQPTDHLVDLCQARLKRCKVPPSALTCCAMISDLELAAMTSRLSDGLAPVQSALVAYLEDANETLFQLLEYELVDRVAGVGGRHGRACRPAQPRPRRTAPGGRCVDAAGYWE